MSITIRHLPNVMALLTLLLVSTQALGASVDQDARCRALEKIDFLKVSDAPTHVIEAALASDAEAVLGELGRIASPAVTAEARRQLAHIHPYCHIVGVVLPSVGFELLLPTDHWNGKFLHVGCGGWCGYKAEAIRFCAAHDHYACIASDMGHPRLDGGLWLRDNPQAQIDFAYRATHVATLAGKAIVEAYYAASASRSYFLGCSTGGFQGLVEAQRYPFDFNGIVAGAPDMDESDLAVRTIWIKQNFLDASGQPIFSGSDLRFIHSRVLEKCDRDDGVEDGVIGDPVHCSFDPVVLECNAGNPGRCLSVKQIGALENIYGVPRTSAGIPVSTRGVFPGSELDWMGHFREGWGDVFFSDTALLQIPGKKWTYRDFNLDRDYPRSGAHAMFVDTNPDLRLFKAVGGKLISYQGGNDTDQIPGAIVDYYETVLRTMGGAEHTQDFFRLFIVPGMSHCTGGIGADAADYLGYLEQWVEHGQAPDSIISGKLRETSPVEAQFLGLPYPYRELPEDRSRLAFTRPLYPYPLHARYRGRGDSNRAESYEPAAP